MIIRTMVSVTAALCATMVACRIFDRSFSIEIKWTKNR